MKNSRHHRLLTAEREQQIIRHLRKSSAASVAELCQALDVSEATVRRDLQSMHERGLLERIHGGACLPERVKETEPVFTDKESKFSDEKQRIAAKARALVQDNDVIYLDGGSTILRLARLLDGLKNLTVVTNSLMAATLLMESGHHLLLTGGEFRAISRTLVGPLTVPVLEKLTIDKAFMGTIGLNAADGITTTDVNEAYTKSQLIARARQVILLADHSKLGHSSFASCGSLKDLDILVTDAVSDLMRQQLEEAGVEVLLG